MVLPGRKVFCFNEDGFAHPLGLAAFLFDLGIKNTKDRIDSRVLFALMKRNLAVLHEQQALDFVTFAQVTQSNGDGLAFKHYEERKGYNGELYLWLSFYQAAILATREMLPSFTSCEEVEVTLADFLFSYPTYFRHLKKIAGAFLEIFTIINRTAEELFETKQAQNRLKEEPEKKIENALVDLLRKQGQEVRQQVVCPHGRADVVTADSIYEIKAVLTRGNLYGAVGQLLSYQACINPSARLFVVGCKPKNEEVERNFANALGIQVIIWNEKTQASH